MDVYGFLDYMSEHFYYDPWTWEMMEEIILYVIDITTKYSLSLDSLVSTLANIIPEVTEEEIRPFV